MAHPIPTRRQSATEATITLLLTAAFAGLLTVLTVIVGLATLVDAIYGVKRYLSKTAAHEGEDGCENTLTSTAHEENTPTLTAHEEEARILAVLKEERKNLAAVKLRAQSADSSDNTSAIVMRNIEGRIQLLERQLAQCRQRMSVPEAGDAHEHTIPVTVTVHRTPTDTHLKAANSGILENAQPLSSPTA